MKRISTLTVAAFFSLFLVPITLMGQAKTVYMSSIPYSVGECTTPTPPIEPICDDTGRIQRAIDSIYSGEVVFDEPGNRGSSPPSTQIYYYNVTNTLSLHSYITLRGSSKNITVGGTPYPSSLIKFAPTSSGKSLFEIGVSANQISFRDLGLIANSSDGTSGFRAVGASGRSIQFIEFRNVTFSGFHYAIEGRDAASGGPTNWQFDNVKMDHSSILVPTTTEANPTIEQRHAGIFVDSANSGWRIYSSNIDIGKHSVGIYFKRVAYTQIDSLVSTGNLEPPLPDPGTFDEEDWAWAAIYVKFHGSLEISNSVSEGVFYDLLVSPDYSQTYPINLVSNTFQGNVEVNGSIVNSIGNQFGLVQTYGNPVQYYSSPMPVIGNSGFVTSIGDSFCTIDIPGGENECLRTWVKNGNGARTLTLGQRFNTVEVPSLIRNYSEVNFPIDYSDSSRPMFSIQTPVTYPVRPLLRLGFKDSSSNYYYDLKRDNQNGYLRLEGNQSEPYRGYSFNGPVALPRYDRSHLPTPQYDGSLIFCEDCDGSSCSTAGSGALAVSDGGTWHCK